LIEIGSTTTRKLDHENIGVAVGIMSLCHIELEMCLGAISPPPCCPQTSQKTVASRRVNARYCWFAVVI